MKRGAAARERTLCPPLAAMESRNLTYDRQAQPGSDNATRFGVTLPEHVDRKWYPSFGRDTNARIPDHHMHVLAILPPCDDDWSSLGSVLDRVANQIGQSLHQLVVESQLVCPASSTRVTAPVFGRG
jgi:hypothetical protein